MPSVEVFGYNLNYQWDNIKREFVVNTTPKQADVSIVLNGHFINPLVLTGKKILVMSPKEWGPSWSKFKPVVEEYYDQIVECLTIGQAKSFIKNEIEKSRS